MVWAVGVGVGVHLAGLTLFAVKSPELPAPLERHAVIGLLREHEDPALREHLLLTDLKPLYLPTERNAGTRTLPAGVRRAPGDVFVAFPPRLQFPGERLPVFIEAPSVAPANAVAALTANARGQLDEFGRVDPAAKAAVVPSAGITIRSLREGTPVLRDVVGVEGSPLATRDWDRVEFSVVVDPAGLVGVPVLLRGSGVEEVDGFLPGYLTRGFRLGERLPPGVYRVIVSP